MKPDPGELGNAPRGQWVKRVRIELTQSPDLWAGRVVNAITNKSIGLEAEHHPNKKLKARPPRGAQIARQDYDRKCCREVFGQVPRFQSFAEFESFFIRAVQRFALGLAARRHEVLAPVNYVEHFWQPGFVRLLAKRLARPKADPRVYWREEIDGMLLECWEQFDLDTLDRDELLDWFQRMWPHLIQETKLNADSLWQRAYRLGLFSKRHPGPKWQTFLDPRLKHTPALR